MNRKKAKKKPDKKNRTIVYALLVALGGLLLVSAAFLLFPRQKSSPDSASNEAGSPRLEVDREQIDFGDVPVGQIVTASFELTNTGTSTLRFTGEPTVQLKAGC
jgi:hypothetical protein